MQAIPLVRDPVVRCAPFHLATGAEPVGSTGHHEAFLCVEVPLPWAHDIGEHEPFRSLMSIDPGAAPGARRWRPQGLVPRGDTDGATRVLAFDSPSDGAAAYRRREWWVDPAAAAALCAGLAADDTEAVAAFDEHAVVVPDDVVELFVCTHGRRDVCCGSSGTTLHAELADRLAGSPDVRLWRVSHTGGHRFAPTAMTFPDGYAWAHLDAALAEGIARRDASVAEAVAHCRGAASVGGPAAQVADRELFARLGWDWLAAHRVVQVGAPVGASTRTEVRIDATLPDGSQVAAVVVVEVAGRIPQPTCGEPEAADPVMSPVWRTVRVDRLPS